MINLFKNKKKKSNESLKCMGSFKVKIKEARLGGRNLMYGAPHNIYIDYNVNIILRGGKTLNVVGIFNYNDDDTVFSKYEAYTIFKKMMYKDSEIMEKIELKMKDNIEFNIRKKARKEELEELERLYKENNSFDIEFEINP